MAPERCIECCGRTFLERHRLRGASELPEDWQQPVSGWEDSGPAPEITAEMLDPKNVKEKISIWLDQDILDFVRETAKKNGDRYQPLINRILRMRRLIALLILNKSEPLNKIWSYA